MNWGLKLLNSFDLSKLGLKNDGHWSIILKVFKWMKLNPLPCIFCSMDIRVISIWACPHMYHLLLAPPYFLTPLSTIKSPRKGLLSMTRPNRGAEWQRASTLQHSCRDFSKKVWKTVIRHTENLINTILCLLFKSACLFKNCLPLHG